MSFTVRFSKLLGECRRQMNGAVAASMRYYGADYGLNYGVSLPTIRSLALSEGKDHKYAQYLYLQQVREIRLASLHIAKAEEITPEEMPTWAEGIINSEVAEEAAFALFQHVPHVDVWLDAEQELLLYTALLSVAKNRRYNLNDINGQIVEAALRDVNIINFAIITLLESYYRDANNRSLIASIIEEINSDYIRSEMEWRCFSSAL